MTNEEFNIKFQEAISELGEDYASDLLQMLQHPQNNPTVYVSSEEYLRKIITLNNGSSITTIPSEGLRSKIKGIM